MIDLGPIEDIAPSLYEPDDLDLPAYAWEFARVSEEVHAEAIIREFGKHAGSYIINDLYRGKTPT